MDLIIRVNKVISIEDKVPNYINRLSQRVELVLIMMNLFLIMIVTLCQVKKYSGFDW